MTPHVVAYLAAGDLDRAADYLARIEALGREKRAAGLADAFKSLRAGVGGGIDRLGAAYAKADPTTRTLYNAAGGALAGGALGGVMGLTGERRKSPWTTALTGALAGGALGAGVEPVRNMLQEPSGTPKGLGAKAQEQADAELMGRGTNLQRFLAKVQGTGPKDDTYGSILRETLTSGPGYRPGDEGAALGHRLQTGGAVAYTARGARRDWQRRQGEVFRAGLDDIKGSKGMDKMPAWLKDQVPQQPPLAPSTTTHADNLNQWSRDLEVGGTGGATPGWARRQLGKSVLGPEATADLRYGRTYGAAAGGTPQTLEPGTTAARAVPMRDTAAAVMTHGKTVTRGKDYKFRNSYKGMAARGAARGAAAYFAPTVIHELYNAFTTPSRQPRANP